MPAILISIVIVFLPLSLATIGGGQSIIAELHRQVVDVHHWMTPAQFVDAFAISRMAPGPGALLVTLIGWHVAGIWGAVLATIAIFGPTTILIYGVANLWSRHERTRWQKAVEDGLRPVATGMILAAVYILFQALEGGWLARAIAVASAGTLLTTRVNPLLLMLAGAVAFIGASWLKLLP
jgi:chromate transporter